MRLFLFIIHCFVVIVTNGYKEENQRNGNNIVDGVVRTRFLEASLMTGGKHTGKNCSAPRMRATLRSSASTTKQRQTAFGMRCWSMS